VKEKLYEDYMSFTKDDTDPIKDMKFGLRFFIQKWLEQMKVEDYKFTKRYSVNVYTSILFNNMNLEELPDYVKFNHIVGGFHINKNNLTSLRGCPYSVTGSFMASYNKLKDLKFGPYIVKESYGVSSNELESLEGIAEIIGQDIYLNNNNLKTLEHIPSIIKGNLNICHNPIETLEYFPNEVKGNILFSSSEVLTEEKIHERCKVQGYIISQEK
jgi:predicted house-cleaning noncanonical NTP pyrophosphatase (MazG superfamily)